MNLFLFWLLQHSIIAIFPCGLKDNLVHRVGNPVHGKARLLFPKHANLQNGGERNLMESGFSRKICPSAHFVGHLPRGFTKSGGVPAYASLADWRFIHYEWISSHTFLKVALPR
jgi:hypothetical protein